jgi:hypothetical protein
MTGYFKGRLMKIKRSMVMAKRFAADNATLVPDVETLILHIIFVLPSSPPSRIWDDFTIHVGKNEQHTIISLTAKLVTKYVVGIFVWVMKMLYMITPTLPRIPRKRHKQLVIMTPMINLDDG